MDLRAYLDGLPKGGVAAFAEQIGVGRVYLSQLAARQDNRVPSEKLCVVIERESQRQVTRQELRADWKEIWPELDEVQTTSA